MSKNAVVHPDEGYFELLRHMPVVTINQIIEFRKIALDLAKQHDALLMTVPELPPMDKQSVKVG